MDDDAKLLMVFIVGLMLLGGVFGWRGCNADEAAVKQKHESFRACIGAGKPPLECNKAIP